MLDQFFADPIALRVAQAVVAALFALAIALIARRQNIHLERETVIALVRGIVQIVLVGFVLIVVFTGSTGLSMVVLLGMLVTAGVMSARRLKDIPGVLRVTLPAIALGAGLVIALMMLLGVIDSDPTSLLPVGSMLIANAMNTAALALDRFRAEVQAHTGQIEAGLALGAAPDVVVSRYVQATVQASMIPSLNNLRSLGIVWIPGLMAGMILAGGDPLEAAIYQFVVIAMLFGTAGVTALLAALLVRSHAFSPAEQLTLRPTD